MSPEPDIERLLQDEREALASENSDAGRKLDVAISTFQRWLHLPDATPLLAVLGAVAANLIPGDPVWVLLIGPPGGGKTELLQPLRNLPHVHMTSTLTEASLLSGSPNREKTSRSSGGLLRIVGDFGILLCKDFTSVLSMNRDSRTSVLAALREIFDGSWTRHVGVDGGKTLEWQGKLGLIGACTSVIDSHHAVIASMGERFVMFRMPAVDEDKVALAALEHQDNEVAMRYELESTVQELFKDLPLLAPPLSLDERTRMAALATLAGRCRSAVERDGYTREVQLIPQPEAPGRLTLVLARLLTGVSAIGASRKDAWRVVSKVALDCIPALRLHIIRVLYFAGIPVETKSIANEVGYPLPTTRRALEDLLAHRVVVRTPEGKGLTDSWCLSNWTIRKCVDAEIDFSEILDTTEDGTFPEK